MTDKSFDDARAELRDALKVLARALWSDRAALIRFGLIIWAGVVVLLIVRGDA